MAFQPSKKPEHPPPPPYNEYFMDMGVSSSKNQKMPGTHKIGAAISGPRVAGGEITDMRLVSDVMVVVVRGPI